ncbi:MAG: AMP-binding protein [Planctomycetes bacterium]|nr:AMP-binding protein [Planctomycetota bacterium]
MLNSLASATTDFGCKPIVNVGLRLSEVARRIPDQIAVIVPQRVDAHGKRRYRKITFRQLDEDSSLLADGLMEMGVRPGTRLALLVRPGIDFVSLVYALFKTGAVSVLIDPGMGRKHLVRCLQDVKPEGFVAIPLAQAVRCLLRSRFPDARWNVTVGRRLFWGGKTIGQLRARKLSSHFHAVNASASDPAAIIFTTGSTGPPKGVLYRHGNFNQQVDEIRDEYRIQSGEIDVATFPLFALFNGAMGVTTVIPKMDPTRPAEVDPRHIIDVVNDCKATQSFGSPALWNTVSRYCEQNEIKLPSLRRILSAGAPVPTHVLRRLKSVINSNAEVFTPYGATEALPVASISASEVLQQTGEISALGAGICVGRRFPGIQWRVIRITDEPIVSIRDADPLPRGEIGELTVRGNVVTSEYVTCCEANSLHKISDGDGLWHRMGDVGYLDNQDRFWFCGRKAHRVQTATGTMFTILCEAIFNTHPDVYRSALVGVGAPGKQRPVVIAETWPECRPTSRRARQRLREDLLDVASSHRLTENIQDVLLHPSLPVDIRHNAKISREKLSVWAAKQLR